MSNRLQGIDPLDSGIPATAALFLGRFFFGVATMASGVLQLGTVFLAVFLVVCGMEHLTYSDFVTGLVPSWIPGQRFWTYFTGVALIVGGAGILVPRTARLAATLSAVMIFLWVLLLHIPRALAGPHHAGEHCCVRSRPPAQVQGSAVAMSARGYQ